MTKSRYHQLHPLRLAGSAFMAKHYRKREPLVNLHLQWPAQLRGVMAWRKAMTPASWEPTGCAVSEFEPHTDGRVDVVPLERVTIGDAVVDGAVHRTGIAIEALREGIDRIERKRFESAAAGCRLVGGTPGIGAAAIAVLMVPVIGSGKFQAFNDGVSNAGPIHLQDLVVGEGRVVDEGQV